MNESPPPARRSRRRGCLIVLLLLLLVLAGAYGIFAVLANRELASAVADIERTDPRWRLEDVEADRADIPESRNAALTVMAIKPLMPAKWPIWDLAQVNDPKIEAQRVALQTSFADLEPQRQLNKEQIDALRAELDRASRALDKARSLADKPEGRYPITYSEDWIGTRLPCLQNTREVGTLLAHDVLLLAQEKHCDQALGSCRAILNAGRSIGDEPMFISQLVRYALRAIAVGRIQRALAQGAPSDSALQQVQQLLEKEEVEPLLLIAARGERAGHDRFMEGIQKGDVKLFDGELENFIGQKNKSIELNLLRLPAVRTSQRAAMLRYTTRIVEAAKLPPEQQAQEMEKLDASAKTQSLLVRLFCPAMSKIAAADIRSRMDLRCASAAVAAERYRQKQNKWPDSLETLRDAGHLNEVPMDLYNGQSVRLKRSEDGLLIYSVGLDGEDNGGRIDPVNPIAKGSDRVFRLWDVSKRRQDAKPLKLAPPPEEGPGIPPGFGPPPDVPPGRQGK